jgi:hypothetical protein
MREQEQDRAEVLDDRKKRKRLEKLEKKIQALSKKASKERVPKADPADIKNRHKRQEVVVRKRVALH